MKTINIILCIALLASCKKDAPEPQPAPTPVVTNQALYGDWILRERLTVVNDSTQVNQYFNSPATCHLYFDTVVSASDPTSRDCIAGHLYCTPSQRVWKVEGGLIVMSGVNYDVPYITADSLVIHEGNKTYYLNR